jgi:S1-C subfamily serine protease
VQSGYRILLTSAQANPGDSGGPVLDTSGALIGVTFAGSGNQSEDKFTYHVHLDEVRSFVASVPKAPILLVPDPWDLPARVELRDLDGDRAADVLIASSGDRPEVLLFDLDANSPRPASNRELAAQIREKKWDFEVAIDQRDAGYISYYDTDNTGTPELVLVTDEDSPAAKGQFVLRAGNRWGYEAAKNRQIVDPTLFRDPALTQRFAAALQRLDLN